MAKLKGTIGHLKQETGTMQREIRSRTVGYVATALGLVAGLAWNEAIKGLIEHLFPLSQNNLMAKFAYAGIITLFVVIISIYLVRLGGSHDQGVK